MVKKQNCFYMDTDIMYADITAGNIYKYIAEDVETRFDSSSYELERSLSTGKF